MLTERAAAAGAELSSATGVTKSWLVRLRSLTRSELVAGGLTSLVFTYALVQALRAYALGFDRPLVGHHDFRQTQTALSALSIAKNGPWLAYETPLFGAPYSIPFEFPLYQWVVALLHQHGGVKLDQAGRAVSIAFFLIALFPFYRLLRNFEFSINTALLTVALLLVAPEYLFWTRSFMMESTALCFSIAALDLGVEAMKQPHPTRRQISLFTLCASGAMLIKVTTGMIYLAMFGLLLCQRVFLDADRRRHLKSLATLALSGLVIPTLLGGLWTRFADYHKAQNALAANFITSRALHDWNFGTWAQKSDWQTWQTFWDRTTANTFGTSVTLVTGLILALCGTRQLFKLATCLLGILGGFATFTNVHLVHDYYQYATSAVAVIIVGLGLTAAERWTNRSRLLVPVIAGAMMAMSLSGYRSNYEQLQLQGNMDIVDIGKYVQQHTPKSTLMVIYGNDWSSVIPYYARRKALMDRWSLGPDHPDIRKTLALSAQRGHEVGTVLFCGGERTSGDGRAQVLLGRVPSCKAIGHCDVCL